MPAMLGRQGERESKTTSSSSSLDLREKLCGLLYILCLYTTDSTKKPTKSKQWPEHVRYFIPLIPVLVKSILCRILLFSK